MIWGKWPKNCLLEFCIKPLKRSLANSSKVRFALVSSLRFSILRRNWSKQLISGFSRKNNVLSTYKQLQNSPFRRSSSNVPWWALLRSPWQSPSPSRGRDNASRVQLLLLFAAPPFLYIQMRSFRRGIFAIQVCRIRVTVREMALRNLRRRLCACRFQICASRSLTESLTLNMLLAARLNYIWTSIFNIKLFKFRRAVRNSNLESHLITSINDFASSFSSDHVKQRRFEVNSYFRRADNLVSEYTQPQVVDVFDFVLLNVDAVHVHQDIADHDHRCLVIFPLAWKAGEEVVIQRF